MGHKKKNPAPRFKHSPAASPAAQVAVGGAAIDAPSVINSKSCSKPSYPNNSSIYNEDKIEPVNEIEPDGSSFSAIKLECERALTSLRRGNHTKALRLMKESSSRHENSVHSALIHRVQGTVCVKVASIIDDPNAKQRHLKNAIESARKAVELSPNSIEFAHFYANLLYEVANEGKEYEEVVQECERALGIENPIDPAKESLQDERQQKIPTAEARIGHVQNELRQLIQKSNIASISTWMKNLGNGEEKFRLIPIRRVTEDPMEVRLVQARRPNEIKKATKTPEERRKDIEVRVAAARLLQQKSETSQMQNEGEKVNRTLDSSSGSGHRVVDRRKNLNFRKHGSSAERRDWVQSYWKSMNIGSKKDLLRIKISDLKAHFNSLKDDLANKILSEALTSCEANYAWKFWICCKCNEKFASSESHMHHVVHEHMGNLLPKMKSILPQNVENERIEMLLSCSWKPIDFEAAVKMLASQTKRKDLEFDEDFYSHTEECDDCFKDAWDSTQEKGSSENTYNNCSVERNNYKNNAKIECRNCHEGRESFAYFTPDGWPISDDPERAKLLQRIHDLFELLIKHKYLAASHLNKVIQFTMDELQALASGSQLLNQGLDQSPMCICFLGASDLKKVLKFLQELSHSTGLGRYTEKSSSPIDDANNCIQVIDTKEKIALNDDRSCLLLDGCLLSIECTSGDCNGSAMDDMIAACSAKVVNGNGVPPDVDALLSWIYAGPSSGEQLASWVRTMEGKKQQGMEILQMLEKEFYHLQSLCERKCEHLSYEKALHSVEDLCIEEGKKRENGIEFVQQSYESVLRQRRKELIETESDMLSLSGRFELDAITNVLKEAEALNVNQFGYEETYAGMTSQLCGLESGEDECWRTKDYFHQVDACIGVAIQRQKEQLSVELSKIDARILVSVTGMQQLELKLEPVCAHDYQSISLSLVKSYLRAHLEDLAEKDATEKSDAAREAFLAELALDSKKGVRGGSDNSRNSQEKLKDKKRNKEFKKTKDLKVNGVNEQDMLHNEIDGLVLFPLASDGDLPDLDITFSENGDDLKLHEEDFRQRIELEADEKKLEETLEYQRRIEEEAKWKHLAEQQKKAVKTFSEENVVAGARDVCLGLVDGDGNLIQESKMEKLLEDNAFPNSEVLTMNGTAVPTRPMTSGLQNISGLPNGGVSENTLPNRRIGRTGRRLKGSTKVVDGSYQAMSSEKNSIEFGSLQLDNHLKEQARVHDNLLADSGSPIFEENGTKTLRNLHVEDDEERFQADLKQAVRQSLDTFQAQQKLPLISCLKTPRMSSSEVDYNCLSSKEVSVGVKATDLFGRGLNNEVGEYNCFLNVIIQSLWHLRRFQDEFLRRATSEHVHVGAPCVVCALYEIFTSLNIASMDTRCEAVAPTSLRIALSTLCPDSNFFQEGQMNDASEVLAVIFDCLHRSFAPSSRVSDTESVESMGSWDCTNDACIVHSIFGMDIVERMNCYSCGLETRHLKYTSFFHNINASALRTTKDMCAESTFDELLNVVEMNHQLACDLEAGGCGKFNYIHHFLTAPPHVFTTVLGWQNTCESADNITATLATLSTDIDISALYRGLDRKNAHRLVSVVCYYGQHYHCFAYSHDHDCWIMYDDKTVKVIGAWTDVLSMCERGHLQPQVLFFEAVN